MLSLFCPLSHNSNVVKKSKLYLIAAFILMALIVLSATSETESKRVIFYGPRKNIVYTGQILSSSAKKEPCPKCQMRDHRNRCRRIVSFNPGMFNIQIIWHQNCILKNIIKLMTKTEGYEYSHG